MSADPPTAPPPSTPPPTDPPPSGPHDEQGPRSTRRIAVPTGHDLVSPAAAALATIAASTALSGVVQGWAWFGDLTTATLLVGVVGVALRMVRLHPFGVGVAQLVALLMLVTGSFTGSGLLGVLPGPEAFGELNRVLLDGFEDIRTGLPPVEASAGIRALIMIAVGLVALIVDVLAVTAAAPAATGLILLCLYAVPSALTTDMLPWWTFAVGVVAFAGLLAVDGSHRHRLWRTRTPARGAPQPVPARRPHRPRSW